MFERYQPSEKALVAAFAEMYVQGRLDPEGSRSSKTWSAKPSCQRSARSTSGWMPLKASYERGLREPFPYLILDARYEQIREDRIIASHAVLIAIGVDGEGRSTCSRSTSPAGELDRAGKSFWKGLILVALHESSSSSPKTICLWKAIPEVLTGVFWQRGYVSSTLRGT
ncbi:transposase [Bradyrhizobium sp. CB1717]|uniref:transposase n=1 Tax=Bradyrhizobium sp. CB1717 TaxID=3039154 RepID=UPI0024B080CD|nr:transposase [Bradyrhizobium sp. CB1717]WFU23694.1 transposase [Bradyrhizobium sp. CB1717]